MGDDGTDARRSGQRTGRGAGGGQREEIFKASHSVFWMSERRGETAPHSTSKVIYAPTRDSCHLCTLPHLYCTEKMSYYCPGN